MKLDMDSRFEHQKLEPEIYRRWEKSGFFNPDNLVKKGIVKKSAKPFSIVLPPPNVTGILHMGSALMLVIEDIMIRFQRMRGKKTLWLPGTDHAAIATEAKVAKDLWDKERKSKHDLGRETFLKRIDRFVEENRSTMLVQMRAMGASLDWSRLAFTLDEARNLAVRTAFKRMYDDGLIYRGVRVVNWDPRGQTTISDDEVEHDEREAILYTFRYNKDFPISIATTRPETKLGDTAVAVHPSDARYKKYVGKVYSIDFIGEPLTIKIVADNKIDPKFGTGALGVTPAHSMIDAAIAEQHNLTIRQVINENGRMMTGGDGIKGEKTQVAREKIVSMLREKGLVEKEEKISQNISVSQRTGAVIEPLPKLQWFVDVNKEFDIAHSTLKGIRSNQKTTLKQIMQTVVRSQEVNILPHRFNKIYFYWIDNLRDWCISRQLWYGHQIPVWYRENSKLKAQNSKLDNKIKTQSSKPETQNSKLYVGIEPPKGLGWTQDPDVLDTWFSAALWTFSTLGWPLDYARGKPKKGSDLEQFHPTDVLETGYDILFFWVARMILMSGYLLGEAPFRTVYLHGIVRDEQRKKISKSLGNNIDPLDMIELYGTDAVRMSLIAGTMPGGDSKISEDKIRGYRNFTTKIWNASRFVLINYDEKLKVRPVYTKADEAHLAQLEKLKKKITTDLESFKFHQAGELLYQYFWHTFADRIVEKSKNRLRGENKADKAAAQEVLITILRECIKMLHPFVPFVTEEVWKKLPKSPSRRNKTNLLMVEKW